MFKKLLAVSVLLAMTVSFAAAQSGKVTIRFFHRWPMEPRFSYFNQVVAEFEKQLSLIHISQGIVR